MIGSVAMRSRMSRIEKYSATYEDEPNTVSSRVSKNQDLYKEVSYTELDHFDLNSVLLFLKSLYNDGFIVPSNAPGRGRTGHVFLAPLYVRDAPTEGSRSDAGTLLLPVLCALHDSSFVLTLVGICF